MFKVNIKNFFFLRFIVDFEHVHVNWVYDKENDVIVKHLLLLYKIKYTNLENMDTLYGTFRFKVQIKEKQFGKFDVTNLTKRCTLTTELQ